MVLLDFGLKTYTTSLNWDDAAQCFWYWFSHQGQNIGYGWSIIWIVTEIPSKMYDSWV